MTKQEIKKEWLRRLRSGEYKQGQDYLNRNGRFCCLGVLCDIAEEQGVVTSSLVSYYTRGYGEELRDGSLPYEVVAWAGLDHSDPRPGGHRLSSMNDSGYTFDQLADIIEEHWH